MRRVLFTIGHSTHSFEYFRELLKKHQIEAIADVRSNPYSRHNPQFNRETLKDSLAAAGIFYVFLGKELGARSNNPSNYVDGKVQYQLLSAEPSFKEGLRRLQSGIDKFRVALMCAERDPLSCHRTILICRNLRAPEIAVEHILADGTLETQRAAEARLLKVHNIQPDMLHGEHECVELAYELQARSIAYVTTPAVTEPDLRTLPDEDLHDRLHQ